MHFYLKLDRQFNCDLICFTACLTVGFVMRNTSPVGWIPLLFIKVFRDGLFPYFLSSAIVISLPIISLTVYLDSLYYSSKTDGNTFEWVFTSWNFAQINVLSGLSKYFGDHQYSEYILNYLPKDIFKALIIFLVLGMYQYNRDMRNK